jgi:hypothetical protein
MTAQDLNNERCDNPDCTADHGDYTILGLVALCHPGKGVDVFYHKQEHILQIRCHFCKTTVTGIAVADSQTIH